MSEKKIDVSIEEVKRASENERASERDRQTERDQREREK